MKNNWKNLGNKVKTELDNQQSPIPDFKEFVEYRRETEPSVKPPLGKYILRTGPFINFIIAIVSMIALAGILYPISTNKTSKNYTANVIPQEENYNDSKNSNNTVSSISLNSSESIATNQLDVAKTLENEQINIKDGDSEVVNDLNHSSNFKATNLEAQDFYKNENKRQFSNNIVDAKAEEQSYERNSNPSEIDSKKRVFVTFGNNTFEVDPSIFENAKNGLTPTIDKEIFESSSSHNKSETTLSIEQKSIPLSNKRITNFSKLPTLETRLLSAEEKDSHNKVQGVIDLNKTLFENSVFTNGSKLGSRINYFIQAGISFDRLNFASLEYNFGVLFSLPISTRHGVELRTGLKMFRTDSRIKTKMEDIFASVTETIRSSERIAESFNFTFLELPVEFSWQVKSNKRFKIYGGTSLQALLKGDGNSATTEFLDGESLSATSYSGTYETGFKIFNLGASLGMEYKLSPRFSVGGLYSRALLKGFEFRRKSISESVTETINGDIHFQNARLYLSYRIR